MSSKLNELLDKARLHVMTPAELEAQRRSFAYGNVKLHNDNVTREMVDKAAEQLETTT